MTINRYIKTSKIAGHAVVIDAAPRSQLLTRSLVLTVRWTVKLINFQSIHEEHHRDHLLTENSAMCTGSTRPILQNMCI